MTTASIIIRSKDEADRLRLTLTSLAGQTETAELIVVNDGSTDHTAWTLAAAAKVIPLAAIHHESAKGRSAAANAGAARAKGDILIFLDGDTLAAPDFVACHLNAHAGPTRAVARGETYHLRGTRFFQDPEAGTPKPGEEARVAALSESERSRMCVTRSEIRTDFSAIHARSTPGIYPGAGPRLLFELEMQALREHPDCSVLWAAASGSNQSIPRRDFEASGGFDESLTINEHRELALRLCRMGRAMIPAERARSYHLTHRSGWRDPLTDHDWETIFYRSHPIPSVALLSVFWASLSAPKTFPLERRILSLPALEAAANRCSHMVGIENVCSAHFGHHDRPQPGDVMS